MQLNPLYHLLYLPLMLLSYMRKKIQALPTFMTDIFTGSENGKTSVSSDAVVLGYLHNRKNTEFVSSNTVEPRLTDTHNITDNSESPDSPSIDFNT